MSSNSEALTAIRNASALLQAKLGGSSEKAHGFGSFQATTTLEVFSRFPDAESFLEGIADLERPADATWPKNPDPKAEAYPAIRKHLQVLLGWAPDSNHAAIKPVVRAAVDLLADQSTFPAAVEMISFAATLVGLIPADRFVDLLALVPGTNSAYQPIRFPAQTAVRLRRLLRQYSLDRKIRLLTTLWEDAHDGRWWDHTHGVRIRLRDNLAMPDAVAADEAYEPVVDLAVQLASNDYHWRPDHEWRLPHLVLTERQLQAVSRHLGKPRLEPDLAVASSYLRQLAPSQRAESPIIQMVELLANQYADVEGPLAEVMPEAPESWADLYTEEDHKRFPIPAEILDLHGREFPGLVGSETAVCRSHAELAANAKYMGNCTGGYLDRSQRGECFIIRIAYGTQVFNASIYPDRRHVGEVASRFNGANGGGTVPPQVTTAISQWVETLPAT